MPLLPIESIELNIYKLHENNYCRVWDFEGSLIVLKQGVGAFGKWGLRYMCIPKRGQLLTFLFLYSSLWEIHFAVTPQNCTHTFGLSVLCQLCCRMQKMMAVSDFEPWFIMVFFFFFFSRNAWKIAHLWNIILFRMTSLLTLL